MTSNEIYTIVYNCNIFQESDSTFQQYSIVDSASFIKQTAYLHALKKEFSYNIENIIKNRKKIALDCLQDYGGLIQTSLTIDWNNSKKVEEFLKKWETNRDIVMNHEGYKYNIVYMSLDSETNVYDRLGKAPVNLAEKEKESVEVVEQSSSSPIVIEPTAATQPPQEPEDEPKVRKIKKGR